MGSLEKLQQTSDELGNEPSTYLIPFGFTQKVKIRQRNFVVKETLLGSSNSLILDHSINGFLDEAIGIGGGQIVLDETASSTTTEILRRRYDWGNKIELENGYKSDNIDISQGFIQLGNVTVKNISLDHKETKNN